MSESIDTDVLIIGGGAAACRAAIESADSHAKVILIDKGLFGHSGCSGMHIGWDMAAGYPFAKDDTPEIHFKDTIRAGGYLNNQKLVRVFTNEVGERMLDLERYGNIYARDEKGNVICTEGSGHSRMRFITPALLVTLKEEVRRRSVEIFEETMISNLLTSKGTVVGATALDIKRGDLLVFRAKSTILATGGSGQLYDWGTISARTTNPTSNCGDGYAMAYRIGTELIDMENVQFLLGVMYPSQLAGIVVPIADQRGYLLDKNKVAFAKDIPREEWNRARAIKEILALIKQGKGSPHGGVWLDAPRAYREWKEKGYVWHFLRLQVFADQLKTMGSDLVVDMIEIAPTCHHFMGGLVINERCETLVPGLYACGEVVGGIHGGNRLGSNALPETQVFGMRAGKYASKRATEMNEMPEIECKQVENEKSRLFNVFNRKGKFRQHFVRHRLQKLVWNNLGPIRNEDRISAAIEEIKKIKEEYLPRMYVQSTSRTYNREWIEALETDNLVCLAEMVARAAMMRTESRQAHQRSDFPETNNENWLVNIYIKNCNGRMQLFTKPIIETEASLE